MKYRQHLTNTATSEDGSFVGKHMDFQTQQPNQRAGGLVTACRSMVKVRVSVRVIACRSERLWVKGAVEGGDEDEDDI